MKTVKSLIVCVGITWFQFGCVRTPKIDDNSEIKIEKEDQTNVRIQPAIAESGIAKYFAEAHPKKKATPLDVQWIKCTRTSPEKEVQKIRGVSLIMHRFEAGFDAESFCRGWIAQVFMTYGFTVVTVNRPGYALSSGTDDLSGPTSIAAIKAGIDAAKVGPITGIWGYDSGAIAAAFYSKQFPTGINWLILGGGIYDLEITLRSTTNENLKSLTALLKAQGGEAFLEKRSIAWDFTGLPKVIGLYHAKEDTFAPVDQADAFTDQLRTSEIKVFRSEIASGGHDIPWRSHLKIVEKSISQVAVKQD